MLLRRTPLPSRSRVNSVPLAAVSSLSAARTLGQARLRAGAIGSCQFHHDAGIPSRARPRAPQLRPNPEAATFTPRNPPRNGITTGCQLSPLTHSQHKRLSSSLAISRPSPTRTTLDTNRQGRSHALDSPGVTATTRTTTSKTPPTGSLILPPTHSQQAARPLHSSASPPGMYTTSFAFFESLGEAGISHVFVNLGSDHPSIIEAMVKGQREKSANFPRIITCPNEVCSFCFSWKKEEGGEKEKEKTVTHPPSPVTHVLTPVSRWWQCPWQTAMPA